MVASAEWIAFIAELTGTDPVTQSNIGRALKAADDDLYTKPPRGSGHKKFPVTARHAVSFLLAQAAAQAIEAPQVVRDLGGLVSGTARVGGTPYFPGRNLRETLEAVLNRFGKTDTGGEAKALPHLLVLSTTPLLAEMVWLGDKVKRGETWVPAQRDLVVDAQLSAALIRKITVIDGKLLGAAANLLNRPENRNTGSLPGEPVPTRA
jgi:hypothetical protein